MRKINSCIELHHLNMDANANSWLKPEMASIISCASSGAIRYLSLYAGIVKKTGFPDWPHSVGLEPLGERIHELFTTEKSLFQAEPAATAISEIGIIESPISGEKLSKR